MVIKGSHEKINVGVIGLGNMGNLHLMNCTRMKDVNVVAISDKSKHILNKAKKRGFKNTYENYQDLLSKHSEELDAVVISLPNFLHFDAIRSSLEAGQNVFIEKPLAVNTDECREILKLVKKSGKTLMPGHSMRFIPAIEKMKRVAESGRLGSLELITLESIQNGPLSHGLEPAPVPEWWFDPAKSGGGALLDLGYHLIDLFRFFAGEARVKYSSIGHTYSLPVEDRATLFLETEDKQTRGVINVGWFEKSIFPRFNFRMILHGNADFSSTEELLPRNLYAYAMKEGLKNFARRYTGRDIHPLSYTYYYESQFKEMRHFIDGIKEGRDPSVTAIDGLKTMEIIDEAYKYSKRGAQDPPIDVTG
jgi:myo-inositol 2-dehydrogenase / D-chiro-inositol 1-dehydrogenase